MKLMFGLKFGEERLTMTDFKEDKYSSILGKNDSRVVQQLYGFHKLYGSGVELRDFKDEQVKSKFEAGNGGSPEYPDELILDNFQGVFKDVKNIYSIRCEVPESIARFYSPDVWIFEVKDKEGNVQKVKMEEFMKREKHLVSWYANWMRWPLWYRLWLWAIRDKVVTQLVEG